ncbi:class I SAM-dependent methyltransferase [Entomobacter blattae]|uniref:Ubiquinone/menaquinone biosynthesis C-methyltransferase UbiE n=1 Tax=Entomobacter blattae TaxID=2762277 RepID=A0A7H1NT41_9PROT|nr:class I SAM-dependent methyltransferase [Entomobacter blattae]QNT78951.1 Ubiquinone/menaquinone biosynthesis C-methyltransferase UbiE [Entomobacter blattae]
MNSLPHDSAISGQAPENTTDFGYKNVPVKEKEQLVRAVFDSVAPKYDIMNDLMSLGIHRVWKKIFITDLRPSPSATLLDLAGGTGDISFGWLGKGGGNAILSDINFSMLSVGRERALERALVSRLEFAVIDAENIALPNGSVERVSMAFGLRNCTNKLAVLKEAYRVLKPGGRFLCLEFSKVAIPPLSPLYDIWSFKVLPEMGALIAKDRESYQYLAESIRMFPNQQTLADMFEEAGFEKVSYQNLSGGIAAIHSGWKL